MNGSDLEPVQRKAEEQNVLRTVDSLEDPDELYVAEISFAELYYGSALARNEPDRRAFTEKIDWLRIMTRMVKVSDDALQLFGETKALLKKNKTPMTEFDLLIACIAKADGHILATNDNDFNVLPDSFVRTNWAKK